MEVIFLKTVTVLITVKNNIRTIKKCIDSVLKLDYPKNKYKIFVVDAFSTDGTYDILKSYGKKIILKQLKGSAPKAYNYAIKMINTELIAFTNADCVVDRKWLKEIIKPFNNEKILAVAGFTSNPPKPETKLQEIIGLELEDRYNDFPKQILRAPDMNLCVRRNVFKKIRFNENFNVGYDADFGYRLNEIYGIGCFIYQPTAIVYHYHRATWKTYFKQQYNYAKLIPRIYLGKHISKIKGDNVSKWYMPIQIVLLYFIALFSLIALINSEVTTFLLLLISTLFLSYLIYALKLSRGFGDIIWFLCLFFVRNVAWNIGILVGIFRLNI
ncbi:MAG: glycosyltransferase [Candidatus Aenigmatarchaeota archaeon]